MASSTLNPENAKCPRVQVKHLGHRAPRATPSLATLAGTRVAETGPPPLRSARPPQVGHLPYPNLRVPGSPHRADPPPSHGRGALARHTGHESPPPGR